jgi:hypothetical protein
MEGVSKDLVTVDFTATSFDLKGASQPTSVTDAFHAQGPINNLLGRCLSILSVNK